MARTKESKSEEVAITDVLEFRFKDESGNAKVRRVHMSGDVQVREEVVND